MNSVIIYTEMLIFPIEEIQTEGDIAAMSIKKGPSKICAINAKETNDLRDEFRIINFFFKNTCTNMIPSNIFCR